MDETRPDDHKTIAAMLLKLASHYYRGDFGPGQVKHLLLDYVEDLKEFQLGDIEGAIRDYRQDKTSKNFPKSGQLRDLAAARRRNRVQANGMDHKRPIPEFGDDRPIMWWTQRPYLWRSHWREEDIPEQYRDAFRIVLSRKRKAGAEGWGENDFYGFERKCGRR